MQPRAARIEGIGGSSCPHGSGDLVTLHRNGVGRYRLKLPVTPAEVRCIARAPRQLWTQVEQVIGDSVTVSVHTLNGECTDLEMGEEIVVAYQPATAATAPPVPNTVQEADRAAAQAQQQLAELRDERVRYLAGALYVQTPHGPIKVTADPSVPPGEVEFRREVQGQWVPSPRERAEWEARIADRLPYEQRPLRVGDRVRWWPDSKDVAGRPLVERHVDGVVERWAQPHPMIRVTGSRGFTERIPGGWLMPAVGALLDTSVSPGAIERLPEAPAAEAAEMFRGVDRSAAPEKLSGAALGLHPHHERMRDQIVSEPYREPDPLDVEYDGVKLRALLDWDRSASRDEQLIRPPMTPAQRAAVSAHWSAELRRKVAESAERERCRVVVDLED